MTKFFPEKALIPMFILIIGLMFGFAAGTDTASAASKPGKVTLTSASANGQHSVVLTWGKGKNAKGYQVYRNGTLIKTLSGAKTLSYTDTNLQPGTTYSYQVGGYVTKKQKQWYNKKTGKWQKKKPAKKARGKAKKVTVYVNGPLSAERSATTQKHIHIFGAWHTAKAAACTEKGLLKRSCSCGAEQTMDIEPKGHAWGEWKTIKEATCKAKGKMQRACGHDKAHIETKDIEMREHIWASDYTIDKAPSCTQEGEKSIHCLACGEKKDVQKIAPSGHRFGEWQMFTVGGEGYKKHTCEICGTTEQEGLDLSAFEWEDHYTVDVEPSCEAEGSESIHAVGFDLTRDSRSIPAIGHAYKETTTPATCTAAGKTVSTCERCGKKLTEVIPAKGHSYETQITKAPTCTEKGKGKKICTICGDETDETAIPALGHDTCEDWVVEREPTCTRAGYKARYCNRCGVKREGDTISTIEHDYGEYVVTKEPTCNSTGREESTCSMCESKKSRILSVTEHTWGDYTIVKEPTCSAQGIRRIYCTHCGMQKAGSQEYIDALPHTWGKWECVTEATCQVYGKDKATCTVCGETKTRMTSSRAPHSYSQDYTVDVEPTQTTYGSESRHCKWCDKTRDERQIPKIITQEERDFIEEVSGKEITLYGNKNDFEKLITESDQFTDDMKAEFLERAKAAEMPDSYPQEIPACLTGWTIVKEAVYYEEFYGGRIEHTTFNIINSPRPAENSVNVSDDKVGANIYLNSMMQAVVKVSAYKNDESFSFNVRTKNYLYMWMDNVLREIIDECIEPGMTEEEQMRAIVAYSARNYTYGTNSLSTTLPGVLIGKRAICGTYTTFFNEVFTMLGIKSRGHTPLYGHVDCFVELKNGDCYIINGTDGFGRNPTVDKLTEDGFRIMLSDDGTGKITIFGYDVMDKSPEVITFPREAECTLNGEMVTREVNRIVSCRTWNPTTVSTRHGIFRSARVQNDLGVFAPKKLVIPNTVIYIEPGAFNDVPSIEEIEIEEGGHFYVEDGALWEETGNVCIWKKGEDVPPPTTTNWRY